MTNQNWRRRLLSLNLELYFKQTLYYSNEFFLLTSLTQKHTKIYKLKHSMFWAVRQLVKFLRLSHHVYWSSFYLLRLLFLMLEKPVRVLVIKYGKLMRESFQLVSPGYGMSVPLRKVQNLLLKSSKEVLCKRILKAFWPLFLCGHSLVLESQIIKKQLTRTSAWVPINKVRRKQRY